MQLYVVGTAGSVLNREVSSIQGVLYWEVLLYIIRLCKFDSQFIVKWFQRLISLTSLDVL